MGAVPRHAEIMMHGINVIGLVEKVRAAELQPHAGLHRGVTHNRSAHRQFVARLLGCHGLRELLDVILDKTGDVIIIRNGATVSLNVRLILEHLLLRRHRSSGKDENGYYAGWSGHVDPATRQTLENSRDRALNYFMLPRQSKRRRYQGMLIWIKYEAWDAVGGVFGGGGRPSLALPHLGTASCLISRTVIVHDLAG
jgi:hypothetical protein